MSLSRDPVPPGEITYEITLFSPAVYRLRRMNDNGSNASQYDIKGEEEFLQLVAAGLVATEGGTIA